MYTPYDRKEADRVPYDISKFLIVDTAHDGWDEGHADAVLPTVFYCLLFDFQKLSAAQLSVDRVICAVILQKYNIQPG